MLAAYLLLYPTSTVRTILPLSFVFILPRVPAWILIIGWFLLQLISGVASLSPDAGAALCGVAYWAYVGGFLTGAILVWVFQRPDQVAKLRAYYNQPY